MGRLDSKKLFKTHRAKVGWLALAAFVFYGLFLFRLTDVTPNFASVEIASQHMSSNLTTIWHDPVNAPYKLLVWLPYTFITESALVTRIAASVFGAAIIWLFFLLLKQRYSKRQAVFGTAIFATSSLFLHASRLGAPYILQMAILLPFLIPLLWYNPRIPRNLIVYVMIAVCVAGMYIPGFLWLALAAILIYRKHILIVVKSMQQKHLAISSLLATILLTPLILASVRDLSVAKEVLGFGEQLPTIREFGTSFYENIRALIVQSPSKPELSLVGAPLLSAVDVVLAFFGIYHLWQKPRLASTYYVSGLLVLALILASLGGNIQLTMAAPLIYFFVAAGIYYLLNQWLSVFPRNPIAKRLAVGLIVFLVTVSCAFHLRSYFVAWSHNEHTKAVFVEPQPAPRKQ